MKKITTLCVILVAAVMLLGQIASAQDQGEQGNRGQRGGAQGQQGRGGQRGPQGGQQRGGGRTISIIALAGIEAVQKEIDMLEDQVKELEDLQEELRGDRGQQGQRGQGGGNNEDLTDEEIQKQRDERRAQAMEQAAENDKKADEGLKKILLDDQYARLHEIYVQALGSGAFQNEAIAKKLGISTKQKTEMEEASASAREAAMEEFSKLRDSGDREAIQKRMTEIRGETESKMMSVLTAKQKSEFEKMKGEPFEIPADALRGQRGGPQGGGGRPGGNQRGGGQRGNGARP